VINNMQGKGKLTLADGRVYEGDFMNNVIHGKGKMTYPTGLVEEGDWIDGEMVRCKNKEG